MEGKREPSPVTPEYRVEGVMLKDRLIGIFKDVDNRMTYVNLLVKEFTARYPQLEGKQAHELGITIYTIATDL